MSVRPHRPARRAAALMVAASTLVVGALAGAQAAAAQAPDADGGVRPLATWPVDQPGPDNPFPAVTTSTRTPTPPTDLAGCEATYEVLAEWPGGFVAAVRVVNVSTFSSLARWEVRVELPEGEVTHAWSSELVTDAGTSATVLRPASWNASLPHGGSTELGFQGTGSPAPGAVTCHGQP